MFGLTSYAVGVDGKVQFNRALNHYVPPELTDNVRLAKMVASKKSGWGVDDFNYLYYVTEYVDGSTLYFPGIFPVDGPDPRRSFKGFERVGKKNEIKQFIENSIAAVRDLISDQQDNLSFLIHDLRRLSSSIHYAADEANKALNRRSMSDARKRINNVISAQTMLSIRTDFLDFSSTSDSLHYLEMVPIYRRVDKVVRCYEPTALRKEMKLGISGMCTRTSRGPNVFEIVPYVVIENAIKYGPKGQDIKVEVISNDDKILVTIESMGPRIQKSEVLEIFQQGSRGFLAKKRVNQGSGIGLHVAKSVVDLFKGSIWVQQADDGIVANGDNFYPTTFFVEVPVSPLD